jgi:ankyrin repeat protein
LNQVFSDSEADSSDSEEEFEWKGGVESDGQPCSVLARAVILKRVECVEALLRHGGVDVNAWVFDEFGEYSEQLVHLAARCANERILELLIKSGAYLDAAAKHNSAHLNLYFIAANNRNAKVMKLIVDAKVADINNSARLQDVDNARSNPLWCAMLKKNEAAVALLIEAGASVAEKDVLCDAAAQGNPIWLRRLCALDNSRFHEFSGAMCREAAVTGKLANLNFLLENDANFDELNESGYTACAIAAIKGNNAIVERLLRAGAKVPSCALGGELETIELLVAAGADMVADFRSICGGHRSDCIVAFLDIAMTHRMIPPAVLKSVLCDKPDLCALMLSMAFDRSMVLVVRLLVSMGTPVRSCLRPQCFLHHDKPKFLLEVFAIGGELQVCHDDWLVWPCSRYTSGSKFPTENALTAFAAGVNLRQTAVTFQNGREHYYEVPEITQRQFELMRLRGLEICIGLQSLELNALVLCEIMTNMFAPIESWVPFHKVWAIVTTVKHWKK